jgi:hypothetical protein
MRWLWTLRTVNGAFGMIAALVLVATVGLAGVGWASLVGNALYTVGIVFGYRRMRALPARPAPLPVGPQRTSTP